MPRHELPMLIDDVVLADGGVETTRIHHDGFDLPYFRAFPLVDHAAGRAAPNRYFDAYLAITARDGVGIVLETRTWRASADDTYAHPTHVAAVLDPTIDTISRACVGVRA